MARFLVVSLLLVCALHSVWASQDEVVVEELPPQVITEVKYETVTIPDDVHTSVVDVNAGQDGNLGCFRDNGARDLPRLAYSGGNSPQQCKDACQKLGFRFAGVQYSSQCFCGNTFGRYGRADNCNMQCNGNNGQTCGGGWANNVYAVPRYVEPVAEGPLEHYGCFRDNGVRDLPRLAYTGGNSPQQCKDACQKLGFRFAGVQYSSQCFCGNTFGRYGRADNCNMQCNGNNGQTCGGGWANNVYNAGGYEEPKPEGDLEFFGCFRDNGNRDLPHLAYTGSNSPQRCKAACQNLGFRFAGVQYSSQCFCGNSFGRYGRADNCNMQCNSNNAQICGGGWANGVYSAAYVKKRFQHLGCFRDNGTRDLPRLAYSGSNSVDQCVSSCSGLRFKFAGVQYSRECWCGNSYGRYGGAGNCNMRCSSNNGQVCGGGWANNVYRINA